MSFIKQRLPFQKDKIELFFNSFFIIFLIGENIALYLENTQLELLFKPALIPILFGKYLISSHKINYWYLTALFFSFWGFFLIIFNKQTLYLNLGTIAFTIGTIVYSIYFLIGYRYKVSIKHVILTFIPFFISAGSVFYIASPNFGDFFYIGLAKEFFLSFLGMTLFVHYLGKNNHKNLFLFLAFFILIFADYTFGIYRFFNNKWFLMNIVVTVYYLCEFMVNHLMISEE